MSAQRWFKSRRILPLLGEDALDSLVYVERIRAERLLNALRLGILLVLGMAALIYAPNLPLSLRYANAAVLIPMVGWAFLQVGYSHWRRGHYPRVLSLVSPWVDTTALTTIILCYGLVGTPAVALNAPIFMVYFAILGARPMTGSARDAAITASLMAVEYAAMVAILIHATHATVVASPVTATDMTTVSFLNEGMKLVLLLVGGAVATYATAWHERVLRRALSVQLARATEERELTNRLQEADKLAALGTLAASIAHEVNSPLAAIALSADLLKHNAADADTRAEAAAIAADARRTATVVRDLLAFARTDRVARAPLALGDAIEHVLRMLRHLLRDGHVTIEREMSPDLPYIEADSSAIERVLVNLIINAVQAMQGQERARIIRLGTVHDAEGVTLTIEDSGPGFSAGVADRLFERFFTTKPAGTGTGLGLWMVAQVVESHGGSITASNTGSGARFVVKLPYENTEAIPFPGESDEALSVEQPTADQPADRRQISEGGVPLRRYVAARGDLDRRGGESGETSQVDRYGGIISHSK